MFRRLSSSLPKDPFFPADLDELGYFINDRDQIRYKNDPELEFIYNINKNDRFNEIQREAMNECIRKTLAKRYEKLGLIDLRVPFSARPDEPHLPILLSPDIGKKSRIIAFFGEPTQDLGVLAYRTIGTVSIHQGSLEDVVAGVFAGKSNAAGGETPGILIANPGQLIWHPEGQRAMTMTTWQSLPRESSVHPAQKVDPAENRIPGNENVENHVAYIFERVLAAVSNQDVKIDVIAMEWTSEAVVKYLNTNWAHISSNISSLILGAPQHTIVDTLDENANPTEFTEFVSKRARAYLVSQEDLDTPIPGKEEYGCNCYSSGENTHSEVVMVQAWKSMLSWLSLVHSVPGFVEVEVVVNNGENDEVPDLIMDTDDDWTSAEESSQN